MITVLHTDSTPKATFREELWTIFLVDDDHDDLLLAQRVLKNSPHIKEIVSVTSGDALFQELRARKSDDQTSSGTSQNMIILDIHMPGIDGVELLLLLRNNPDTKNIPVMILSGDPCTDTIETTYSMHANGFISKPLTGNDLDHVHAVFSRGNALFHECDDECDI